MTAPPQPRPEARHARRGGRRSGRSRWRLLAVLGLLLLAVSATVLTAAYQQLGRTPAEIVGYLRKRLIGHPTLEMLAEPVLTTALDWLDEPDPRAPQPPFQVPPPPGGPMRLAAPASPVAETRPAADPAGVLRVGPGRSLTRIAMAARLARDGDTIEIDPGDYVADVAVWTRNNLTLRGTGPRVRLFAAGAHAEGKAIWVVRGGKVLVENIDFIGARVPDGNGAGIRLESGQLTVRNCLFHGNQNGIMTSGDARSSLVVEGSEFGYNGAGDGLTHGLYAGHIRSLSVSGSHFHHANGGHLIKSRALESHIAYNRLSDEAGGRASYELEFPNGGMARVIGNILQQTAETRNSVMLSYGAEGLANPVNALFMVHNTLVNDRALGGSFVRVWPGTQQVLVRHNLWIGPGRIHIASADDAFQVDDNARGDWSDLAQPSREDYRIRSSSRARLSLPADARLGDELQPRAEYQHPHRMQPLAAAATLMGAVQTPGP